jgi:hypothetical protein
VLGTGATPEVVNDTAWRLSPANPNAIPNPFTGRPFSSVDVVGQGKASLGSLKAPIELFRVATDHLNLHLLSSPSQIRGEYNVVMCHSNGCTLALEAIRRGDLKANYVYAFGTDWTTRTIPRQELHGAQLTFFGVNSDPIKYLPAPRLESKGHALYLQWDVRFDRPSEIPRSLINLVRGRPNDYPYVDLRAPRGLSVINPVDQHYMLESYFKAVRTYMQTGPANVTTGLAAPFRSSQPPPSTSSATPSPPPAQGSNSNQKNLLPPGPPGPPGGGGPGTGPGSGSGHTPGMLPATAGPRGGIKADISITDADFVPLGR